MKRIVLTGGGTAGHVMPNLALLPNLREEGWDIVYIGSDNGIERRLAVDNALPYEAVATGKLRRYWDPQNLKDPFRVLKGAAQSYGLLRRLRPNVIFSKGGFVALPVVIAAKLLRIPVILHEADVTLGLANRLALPFADTVAVSFPESLEHLPQGKVVYTGLPIRAQVLSGNRSRRLEAYRLSAKRPILLVTGGSLGAQDLNRVVWDALPELTAQYQVIHLCGRNKVNPDVPDTPGYVQMEYANEEMPDLLAMSDVVVSRAGSNMIWELVALRKPHLLVPLPASKSRGDQLVNAKIFAGHGYSVVVEQEQLTPATLLAAVDKLYRNQGVYIDRMRQANVPDGVNAVMNLIRKYEHAGRRG